MLKCKAHPSPVHQDMHAWTWAADNGHTLIVTASLTPEDVAFCICLDIERFKRNTLLIGSPDVRPILGLLATLVMQFVPLHAPTKADLFSFSWITHVISSTCEHFSCGINRDNVTVFISPCCCFFFSCDKMDVLAFITRLQVTRSITHRHTNKHTI